MPAVPFVRTPEQTRSSVGGVHVRDECADSRTDPLLVPHCIRQGLERLRPVQHEADSEPPRPIPPPDDTKGAGLRGVEALRDARMPWNDVLENGPLFAAALGLENID